MYAASCEFGNALSPDTLKSSADLITGENRK